MARTQDVINAFARAVGKREGVFKEGKVPTLPQRLGNPACLKHWKDPAGCAYPEVNGFVQFPQCERDGCVHPDHPHEVGWRAARAQVKINVVKRGLTFFEFFAGKRGVYDGHANARDKNDPQAYAEYVVDQVCRELGVDARCSSPGCLCQALTAPRCVHLVVADLIDKEERDAAAQRNRRR